MDTYVSCYLQHLIVRHILTISQSPLHCYTGSCCAGSLLWLCSISADSCPDLGPDAFFLTHFSVDQTSGKTKIGPTLNFLDTKT